MHRLSVLAGKLADQPVFASWAGRESLLCLNTEKEKKKKIFFFSVAHMVFGRGVRRVSPGGPGAVAASYELRAYSATRVLRECYASATRVPDAGLSGLTLAGSKRFEMQASGVA